MNSIILQPSGNKDAREHYQDTIANPKPISEIAKFLSKDDLEKLESIYPNGDCMIWGVTPSKINIGKWSRIRKGDVTLFSKSGGIYASAVTTLKLRNPELAYYLWSTNNKGQTWEYIYFLDEVVSHNIPYSVFNEAVGYAPNYIIQGFNVLDQEKSKRVLTTFNLESDIHLPEISETDYSSIQNKLQLLQETDSEISSYRRLEQGYLKQLLFGNKTEDNCSCCGRQLPISLLVAAHIKKRANCSIAERKDPNVVIAMCKLGCDELFEKGFIYVNQGKVFKSNRKGMSKDLIDFIDKVHGLKCHSFNSENEGYFKWHQIFHKN